MDNYLFQAAPKPVQTRTKKSIYREPEESKEPTVRGNLMNDRRVARGSTYAPSKRTQPLPTATFRPVQHAQSHSHGVGRTPGPGSAQQHPLPMSSGGAGRSGTQQHQGHNSSAVEVDFIRIATPEPVAGRCHTTVQTDTYLEDLRKARAGAGAHEFSTQTDAENDRPTPVLFVPRSSGDDISTEVDLEAGDLFDFDLEVQAVVGVLSEKTLEQALMEVLEENELEEIAAHQSAHQQRKNNELVAVQQLVQRDERRQAERDRRAKQEADRLASEKKAAEARAAAVLAKKLVERMQEDTMVQLIDQGAFFDPVRREVDTVFMPQLIAATHAVLQQQQLARDQLDALIQRGLAQSRNAADAHAIAADEERVAALVRYQLDPTKEKRPQQSILSLAVKAGLEDEDAARRALQLSSAAAASEAAAAASGRRGAAAPTPEERAAVIVAGILAEREAARKAKEKEQADIIRIQAVARGRRDRARAQKLADKRRLEAERAAMSPQELLASLASHLGFTVSLLPAAASSSSAAASSSSSAPADSSSSPIFVISSLDRFGPASQAGLVLGDQILSFGPPATELTQETLPTLLSPAALKQEPYSLNPGSFLHLSVIRRTTDGRKEDVRVELSCSEDGFKDQERIRDLRAEAELAPLTTSPWLDAASALEQLQKLGPGKLGANVVDQRGGARLSKVTAGSESAAFRAALVEGDVIVSLDGEQLSDSKALTSALKERMVGDVLPLELLSPAGSAQLKEAGGDITARALRNLPTVRKQVELGGGGKKLSVEQVRALRRIAGLPVFGEP